MRAVTINGGIDMRAWYDIASQDIARKEDEQGVRQSQTIIEALIATEVARGVPVNRIVLAGFSQGGVIALQTSLRQPKQLAGVMALSAYLPLAETLVNERHAASQNIPVFLGHGTTDNVVPLALGSTSRDRLIKLGYDVDWHQYPMAHSVCAEELKDIGALVPAGARLTKPSGLRPRAAGCGSAPSQIRFHAPAARAAPGCSAYCTPPSPCWSPAQRCPRAAAG